MNRLLSVYDYEKIARTKLSKHDFEHIACGAFDETTLSKNCTKFNDIQLKPLCLRDVSNVSLTTNVLNRECKSPLLIAPCAFHGQATEHAELSTAAAAKKSDVPMVVSTMSNISLELISSSISNHQLWLQVYIFKDRSITKNLVLRAESSGYKAIVVTVGVPHLSHREPDLRNGFSLPDDLTAGNFPNLTSGSEISSFISSELDDALVWDDIRWLQSITELPIILKGILNPVDAEMACKMNLSGIIVSNHGGRILDTSITSIDTLSEVANVVDGTMSVMLDSGIRRGSDIFKAITLGADAVLLGRPVLWALAVGGTQALCDMLSLLHEELRLVMKLTGCNNFKQARELKEHLIYRERS